VTFGHTVSGSVETPVQPPATTASGVEVIRDLVYGRAADKQLLADVYRPAAPGPHPAVLYLHGGGWQRGARTDYADARLVPVAAGASWSPASPTASHTRRLARAGPRRRLRAALAYRAGRHPRYRP
jgi:acetyl esterase/lipase